MTVRAVLWDADGVLQVLPGDWATATLGGVLGDRAAELGARFLDSLEDALVGRVDMRVRIETVLSNAGLADLIEATLAAWRDIEPVSEARGLVVALPVPSYLATNQDTWRTSCMREAMGYDALLAGQYYSAEIGLAKPDLAFFRHIVDDLGLPPDQVLFVDDRQANVDGARAAGLPAECWSHLDGIDALRALLGRHGLPV